MLMPPSRGDEEHFARHDQAVGHDDQYVGAPRAELRPRGFVASVCGCASGSRAASAACFTALAVTLRPRPLGRSGCVRTPTTSW